MNKRAITIVIHITCWALYLLLPVIFSPGFSTGTKEFAHIFGYPLWFLAINLFLVPLFYFNAYFLVPKFFFYKKPLLYFGCTFLLLILFLLIPEPGRMIITDFRDIPSPFQHPERLEFMRNRPNRSFIVGFRMTPRIFSFCLVWLLGILIQAIERWRVADKRSKENELEKVNAELSYLKLQINPHFLFNTLNNIYSLASAQSPQTPAAVMKLSEIMRYVTQEAQADTVPLENEIRYIANYIELQKMRSNDKLELRFTTSGNFSSCYIAPLLLISFIENAFKYGTSNHEKSMITIGISENQNVLFMHVRNSIFERPENRNTSSIGISNTRRRLSLLYPGKYSLDAGKKDNIFNVELKIELL